MIKKVLFISVVLLLVIPLFSCSDDGDDEEVTDFAACSLNGPNFSISDLVGNWLATQANFDIPGTMQQVDVVAEGGTVILTVRDNGGFTLVITESGGSGETTTGDLAFCEELFTVRYDDAPNEPETIQGSLNNDVFTITGPVEYDVDGDGNDDDAFVILRFIRN